MRPHRTRVPYLFLTALLLAFLFLGSFASQNQATAAGTPLAPAESRAELVNGNLRFKEGKAVHPRQDTRRRIETAREGQAPIAAVLACSDSREAVELIFDQGVGDLFVIRVAGNSTNEAVLGSIEYAVDFLHIPLLVVLGHTECGAVDSVWQGEQVHGNLAGLLAPIVPAVQKVRSGKTCRMKNELMLKELAAKENVRQSVATILKENPILAKAVAEDKLMLLGALYNVESGEVAWIEPGSDDKCR